MNKTIARVLAASLLASAPGLSSYEAAAQTVNYKAAPADPAMTIGYGARARPGVEALDGISLDLTVQPALQTPAPAAEARSPLAAQRSAAATDREAARVQADGAPVPAAQEGFGALAKADGAVAELTGPDLANMSLNTAAATVGKPFDNQAGRASDISPVVPRSLVSRLWRPAAAASLLLLPGLARADGPRVPAAIQAPDANPLSDVHDFILRFFALFVASNVAMFFLRTRPMPAAQMVSLLLAAAVSAAFWTGGAFNWSWTLPAIASWLLFATIDHVDRTGLGFEEASRDYSRYHTKPLNKLSHMLGIPLIVLGIVHWTQLDGSLFPWASIFLLVHALWNWRLAAVMAAVVAGMAYISSLPFMAPWWVSLAIFALGWVFQFMGHGIEGKKPAFTKNAIQLLVGPLWILQEIGGWVFRRTSSSAASEPTSRQ